MNTDIRDFYQTLHLSLGNGVARTDGKQSWRRKALSACRRCLRHQSSGKGSRKAPRADVDVTRCLALSQKRIEIGVGPNIRYKAFAPTEQRRDCDRLGDPHPGYMTGSRYPPHVRNSRSDDHPLPLRRLPQHIRFDADMSFETGVDLLENTFGPTPHHHISNRLDRNARRVRTAIARLCADGNHVETGEIAARKGGRAAHHPAGHAAMREDHGAVQRAGQIVCDNENLHLHLQKR